MGTVTASSNGYFVTVTETNNCIGYIVTVTFGIHFFGSVTLLLLLKAVKKASVPSLLKQGKM